MMPVMDLYYLCVDLHYTLGEFINTLWERWNAYSDEAGEGYYQLVYFD